MPSLKLSSIKPGDKLIAECDALCLEDGEVCEVFAAADGRLYVGCDEGRHYLDEQTARHDPDELLGFSRAPETVSA